MSKPTAEEKLLRANQVLTRQNEELNKGGYPLWAFPNGPTMCCSDPECGCQGLPCDPPIEHEVEGMKRVNETLTADVDRLTAALKLAEGERDEARGHLKTSLDFAREYQEGCLWCGADVLLDDGDKEEHGCWYEKAEAALSAARDGEGG